MIKKVIFIFSFALLYTVNCLFFQDWTINRIYEENGDFNLLYQLPQIIYSSIISSIIILIVKTLGLTEKKIIEIKKNKDIYNEEEKINKILKLLKIKFILFFIMIFLFLILFWYYLGCFCAVYKNTQIHLLKDALISFGLSLIYPLGLNLLPGIFRTLALKKETKKRKLVYLISQIFQIF